MVRVSLIDLWVMLAVNLKMRLIVLLARRLSDKHTSILFLVRSTGWSVSLFVEPMVCASLLIRWLDLIYDSVVTISIQSESVDAGVAVANLSDHASIPLVTVLSALNYWAFLEPRGARVQCE